MCLGRHSPGQLEPSDKMGDVVGAELSFSPRAQSIGVTYVLLLLFFSPRILPWMDLLRKEGKSIFSPKLKRTELTPQTMDTSSWGCLVPLSVTPPNCMTWADCFLYRKMRILLLITSNIYRTLTWNNSHADPFYPRSQMKYLVIMSVLQMNGNGPNPQLGNSRGGI